jgi:hypothetical protein
VIDLSLGMSKRKNSRRRRHMRLRGSVQLIGPMGGLLLALGLGAKGGGETIPAVDALIASLAKGRLSDAVLSRALIEAASSGAIKFARWLKLNAIFVAIEAFFESGQEREASELFQARGTPVRAGAPDRAPPIAAQRNHDPRSYTYR